MGLALVKRLVVCLTVLAFIGAPWAQAFAQTLVHGCDASGQTADGNAIHSVYHPSPSATASNKADAGKNMIGNCVRNCSVPLNLIVPANSIALPSWPQSDQPAMNAYLHGRTLEPELSPPIDLV